MLLRDDSGFAGKEIERETLNTIIHLRLRETFELLKRKLEEEPFINYIGEGIFITGGCSHLKGIDHLAEEVFELPARVAHAQTMSGLTSAFENPQFSAAIGLIKYAQAVQADRRAAPRLRPHLWQDLQRYAPQLTQRSTNRMDLKAHDPTQPQLQPAGTARTKSSRSRSIGVGGAGSNALDRIVLDGLEKADSIVANTDVQSLASSVAADKVQLGRTRHARSRHRRRSGARLRRGDGKRG